MICPKCHAQLPDGTIFCTGCGVSLIQRKRPAQQPNVQYQQPGMQYQQSTIHYKQPTGSYQQQEPEPQPMKPAQNPTQIHVPKYVKPSICRIVGAVLILISAIVPFWFGASVGGYYSGAGFFATGGGILGFWGVLMLLTGLALLFFEVDVTAIRNYQEKFHALPYARFYLPGFALFLLILGTFAHSLDTHDIGWGWWLCLIGILLSCIQPGLEFLKEKRG